MKGFAYDRAANCVKVGYEINRIAFILHFISMIQSFSLLYVAGLACIVLSYACVYFAESFKLAYRNEAAGYSFDLGVLVFTTISLLLWFIYQIIGR